MGDSLAGTDPGAGSHDLAAVVLAAGAGRRLRPLSLVRPKPLCPVGGVPLVDLALTRCRAVTSAVAVNVHHGRAQLEEHLGTAQLDVHVSVEEPEALGTAGALGLLRPWLDGRGVLVVNADAWSVADLVHLVDGHDEVDAWDGERVRVLVADQKASRPESGREGRAGATDSRPDLFGAQSSLFGPRSSVVASLLPWSEVARLEATPTGLYELCWQPAHAEDRLDAVAYDGPFVDCGTPADYLAANLQTVALAGGSIVGEAAHVSGSIDHSVIGVGARIDGRVQQSVIWSGLTVEAGETLDHAVRADERTTVVVR